MRNVMVAIVVALATAFHASVWLLMHEQVSPPNADGVLASLSFSPINPKHDGETDKTSEAQIRSDLAAVAPYTRGVRTYSVSNGLDRVPQLASEVGLRVTIGAWINEWEPQNEREIENAIALAKQYRNIDSVIVGNEAVFRAQQLHAGDPKYDADHTVKELIAKIQRVKREVRVPVTTCLIGKAFRARARSTMRSTGTNGCAKPIRENASSSPSSAGRARGSIAWMQCRARSPRPMSCGISSPAPTPWASTIRSSRRSISRGRRMKAASVPIGGSSTPTGI